ncbi:MAG: hypothetical protein QXN59_02260 [Candidatus Micrarchaeaceae archaeon]
MDKQIEPISRSRKVSGFPSEPEVTAYINARGDTFAATAEGIELRRSDCGSDSQEPEVTTCRDRRRDVGDGMDGMSY